MFTTKPVSSLRRLFAGYHEPAGLSKQQSQKLLDGLKTSFRNQLDQEYGESATVSKQPLSQTSSDAAAVNRHSATSQHLKSILTNPLFSYNKTQIIPPIAATAFSVPKRAPMEVFDHAVARGLMNLKAATGCLMAEQKDRLSAQTSSTLVSPSDVAVKVVRWLRASGLENDLAFLDNQQFVRSLTPFLVAEQMDHIAWEWVSKAMEGASANSNDDIGLRRASFLLAQLVHVKSQPQYGNLDAAISVILQAEQLLANSPLLAKLLVLPWRSVSWLSTVESYSRTTPSEELFDAHLETASRLSQPCVLEMSHLHLYHPTRPDHTPALAFFQDKKRIRRLVQNLDMEKVSLASLKGMSRLRWVTYLGRDTVTYLTQSGRNQDAQSLTELLQTELSELFVDQNMRPT
ncbi:hypothetical protein VHEMI03882 [[Torrubiella] hemipterigena]|uniref:Uncharacterized protein n=1 Tax=[Torrubiella] hemipterigena TaxID=1531966 RepID=A0A0A1TC73_9HYPO|nr:hypothetical protein VHEMI03882 [[Torrubiella] hemipterigena]